MISLIVVALVGIGFTRLTMLALELREPWFDALPAGHEDLPAQLRARHGVGPWGNRWAAALKDEPPRDGDDTTLISDDAAAAWLG